MYAIYSVKDNSYKYLRVKLYILINNSCFVVDYKVTDRVHNDNTIWSSCYSNLSIIYYYVYDFDDGP